jgi:photosystem II stability/assembly factor-like uncharacterized protein
VTDRDSTERPSELSRREFMRTAGQVALGIGLLPAPLALREYLTTSDTSIPPELGGLSRAPFVAPDDVLAGLKWRMLGPFRGGRVAAVSGVPGRPNEFYFGSVNGGVWKTIDGGRVWNPIFDSQPVASIGAISVAPSAPNVVYVGSGESTLRDSAGFGNGMYKSTDAGKTWTHIGLDDTQHIGKIAIHPRNPDVVFVAAIGHLYAPNAMRGVFRSRDGGRSWQKVLFKDDNVGAVEVAIDPTNPSVVYAGLWNTRRPPWYTYAPTNGPGGGIYKSVDGGSSWKQLTTGLPKEGIGRTGIAVAPSNPRRVYAVVDCLVPESGATPPPPSGEPPAGAGPQRQTLPLQGGFFRSDDAGQTWTRVASDTALWGRGWYFEKLTVDPKDPDTVYVPNVAVNRTRDGGKTWDVLRGSPGGDDYHQPWVSPDDPNTMIVASDQGAVITRNAKSNDPRDVTWSSWLNQPTAQIYHLSVDYRFPYWVTGAQQDSGAVAVRSRGKFAEISIRDWEPIGAGGESGYTAGDPQHPGIVFGGSGARWDLETNTAMPGTTAPTSPEPARTDWTQPLVFSKADHALYYANQFLFRSTDGAQSWTQVSPDLTRPDPGIPGNLDAAAAAQVDRNGKRGVIYTIAPSPKLAATIWVGTDDGLIHLTANGGQTWQNVTPSALTPWSRVTMMEASRHDTNVAYASVDRHQLQDFEPYIYRTRDMGKTWQRITKGLPAGLYVHFVKEDPVRQGMLYSGTERGAYVSFDDGDNWQPLQLNLPITSMRDLEVYENDLIIATHGRGFWVIDDVSPLRQLTSDVLAANAYLFKPSDTTYFTPGSDNGTPVQKDEPQAQNPPSGAYIDYYLKTPASGVVTIDILDATGKSVRTFSSDPAAQQPVGGGRGGRGGTGGIPNVSPLWQAGPPAPLSTAAGLHRVAWNPVVGGGGRFGGGGGRGGATVLTGTFTAKLTVGGQSYTQTFTVRPDPRTHG